MTKTLFITLLAAVFLTGGFVSSASAQARIATVDIKKIFETYHKARETDEQIHDLRTKANKELEDRLETYKNAVKEVQKLDEDLKRPELGSIIRSAKEK